MTTKVLPPSDDAIRLAGKLIFEGNVVGMPTETVYGLAANALDESAVSKIYEAKGRPSDNPLIVHISSIEEWNFLVEEIPESAQTLAEAFWPGPLTIILKKSEAVPNATSGGLNTVAVRMPLSDVARKIIKSAGVPIAAPSANISGKPSPTTASAVLEDMNGRIPLIIDGGESSVGVESTVVSLVGGAKLLRPGGITPQMLQMFLPELEIDPAVTHELENGVVPSSPGMKYKHYAPNADITIIDGGIERFIAVLETHKEQNPTVLCFDEDLPKLQDYESISLGSEQDFKAQAHNLFEALRSLDSLGAKLVFARMVQTDGVGLAVYNRLIRAAGFKII